MKFRRWYQNVDIRQATEADVLAWALSETARCMVTDVAIYNVYGSVSESILWFKFKCLFSGVGVVLGICCVLARPDSATARLSFQGRGSR